VGQAMDGWKTITAADTDMVFGVLSRSWD
jgi:hypothetical protein